MPRIQELEHALRHGQRVRQLASASMTFPGGIRVAAPSLSFAATDKQRAMSDQVTVALEKQRKSAIEGFQENL